jgi:hypothetical protein
LFTLSLEGSFEALRPRAAGALLSLDSNAAKV